MARKSLFCIVDTEERAVAVGGSVGGLVGVLIGLGMPEYEAKRYEGKIKDGNILLSVHLENDRAAERAQGILERCGGLDIAREVEVPVPGDHVPIPGRAWGKRRNRSRS